MASHQQGRSNTKTNSSAAAAAAAENHDQESASLSQETLQDGSHDHRQSLVPIENQNEARIHEELHGEDKAQGHQQEDHAMGAAAPPCALLSGQPINTGSLAQVTGSQKEEFGKPKALENFQNRRMEGSTSTHHEAFVSSNDGAARTVDATVSQSTRSFQKRTRNNFERKQQSLDPFGSTVPASTTTIAAHATTSSAPLPLAQQSGAQAVPNHGVALTKDDSNNEVIDNQNWKNPRDRVIQNEMHCSTASPVSSSSPVSPSFAVSPADSTLTATTADLTPVSSVISAPTSRLTSSLSLSLPSLSSGSRSSSLTPNQNNPGNHSVARLRPQEQLVEATLIVEDDSTTHHSDSRSHHNNVDLEVEGSHVSGGGDGSNHDNSLSETAPLHRPRIGIIDISVDDEAQSPHYHSTPIPLITIAQAKPAHVEDSVCDLWKSRTGKMLICALITVVVVVAGGIAFAVNNDNSNDNIADSAETAGSLIDNQNGTLIAIEITAAPTTTNAAMADTAAIESETSLSSQSPATPTTAPTTNLQGSIVSLLPNYTLISLQDPTSPQSKALKWLTRAHSPEFLSELTDSRIRQRFALASFYFATNGNGWQWRRYWLSTDPSIHECDWWSHHHELPGFTGASSSCNEDTLEFEKLALSLNNLKGYLVPEVALLTNLREISLVGDNFFQSLIDRTDVNDKVLSGSFPTEWFKSLTKLKSLDISKNALTGSIATEIGLLSNLEKLHINENDFQLQIPSELFGLPKIENLWLFKNRFSSSLPTEIGMLKEESNLISFLAYENLLGGSLPSEIGSLQQLTQLKVGLNRLTGMVPTEITNLQDLRFLFLEDNQLSGTIHKSLGNMTALLALQVGKNRKF